MVPNLLFKNDRKKRTRFYASDAQKLEADIWCELKEIEPTNPTEWQSSLKWGAGKGVELAMIDVLKMNGLIDKDYDQEKVSSVQMTREGIEISMKFDALLKAGTLKCSENLLPQCKTLEFEEGTVLEVKSINNKNFFDIQKYIDGYPKENYVMQLSMYMDYLQKETGYLFVASIDGLNCFIFENKKIGEGVYQCGNTIVDINAEYKRFAEIMRKFKAGEEPDFSEEIYKIPVEKVDWHLQTKTDISKARNNQKVIGSKNSWKISYSPYKNLILEKQNTKPGYEESELLKIAELTKGYTKWE